MGLVVVLALLAGVLSVVDVLVRDGVQSAIADRIEARSPGSHATVRISSFPFTGRLAVSGRVPGLSARVTDVTEGDIRFTDIDLDVHDLDVDRGDLTHGEVKPTSIRSGHVVADISQDSIRSLAHLPLTLGDGTVGADGVTVHVQVTLAGGGVVVGLGDGLPTFTVPVPELDILPCVGSARVVPHALQLSCTFTTLPGLLAGVTFHA